jgi:glutathione S-transferase
VHDSWAIAEYLDQEYPNRPLLINDESERVLCRFLQYWSETAVLRPVMQMIAVEATNLLVPEDQGYFRATREARFGATFEDLVKDRETRLPELRASFEPLRRDFERRDFIAGKAPSYADYIVFGIFQWAQIVSEFEVLDADDPIRAWRGRMLDLFGGLARQTPAYGN